MLRVYLVIFAALVCSGCLHRSALHQFRTEPDAVYYGHGVYPDWTLKVSRTSIYFRDALTEIREDIDPAYFGSNQFRHSYSSERIGFWTASIQCFDHKSRRFMIDTVTVQVEGKILRGCGGVAINSEKDHLAGTNWRVEKIGDLTPINTSIAQIRFSYGRLIAFVGCNRLTMDYSANDGEILFRGPQSTKRECSEPEKRQETKLLEITGRRATFDFDAYGNLIIRHPERGKILMSPTT